MKDLKYKYVGDETPEERLRNKLSPLYALVNVINIDPEYPKLDELLVVCKANLIEIKEHLDDIIPFYTKLYTIGKFKYKQDNTLEENGKS
jgi:hypothetical protein